MKKLALSLAVLFAVGLVSCGGNKEDKACDTCPVEAAEEVAVVEDVTPDTAVVAVDSAAVEAPAETPAE